MKYLKHALGVDGVLTKAFAYYSDKTQIDMVLERGDRNVNIIEMKYCDGPYTLTAKEAEKMKARRQIVGKLYRKRMAFSTIMVTAENTVQNQYSSEMIQRTVSLSDLFKDT